MRVRNHLTKGKLFFRKVARPPKTVVQPATNSKISQKYEFELFASNCGGGISFETLNALAESYDVPVDNLIQHALVLLAIEQIPGFDTETTTLSETQLEFLRQRRLTRDAEKGLKSNSPSLLDQIKDHLRAHGETDEHTERHQARTRGSA